MKKENFKKKSNQNIYPRVGIDIIDPQLSNSKIDLWIECGNLYLRENVSLWDDIEFGLKKLRTLIDEYNPKYKDKLTEFDFDLSYHVPNPSQIKLLDDKKFEEFEGIDGIIHYFTPIKYMKKDNTLYVSTDTFASDYKTIASVANLIEGLKEVSFMTGSLESNYLDSPYIDSQYIRKTLNNKKWSRWLLACDQRYDNDIDVIKELRSLINKDINLDFSIFHDQIHFIKKEGLI